ncbi:MAG: YabP/YqfC family sporulation protein [Clostridia bacterium]|nr:YabP/YqfC family sporulation protein [Clostridia bacterium]
MGYWNEIVANFCLPHENFAGGSRISIFDDVGVLIEGHRGIVSFAPERMEIRLNKRKLVLFGKDMRIARCNRYEIYIVGKIGSIEREE